MCGLFSLSTMQPAVLSEQIGKSEQRNRESGKGVKGAHNCKGEMKTTMSSILQIYLLRTCMYVCRTSPPRHRRSRGEGEELEERAKWQTERGIHDIAQGRAVTRISLMAMK